MSGPFHFQAMKQGLQIGVVLVRCGGLLVRNSFCVNKQS